MYPHHLGYLYLVFIGFKSIYWVKSQFKVRIRLLLRSYFTLQLISRFICINGYQGSLGTLFRFT
jgi:hypothetical protein